MRLSGQDSERGTFSQRHSVLIDQETEARYMPLNHIRDGQARFEVINSMLSEEAVLGFEYGYSLAEPNALTLVGSAVRRFRQWRAGGRSTSSSRRASASGCACPASSACCRMATKGQGPEHSSARLERYLQLCAEDNMQVANCTTPANYFHILRRQLKRDIPQAADPDDAEIAAAPQARGLVARRDRGRHDRSIACCGTMPRSARRARSSSSSDDKIRRVVLCSGKVYYDLYEEREKRGVDDVYLLRVEQLYPFPLKALVNELSRFRKAEIVWCQEEPKNMGAWTFVEPYLEWVLARPAARSKRPRYVGRPAAAATATGLMSKHLAQLKAFLDEAFVGLSAAPSS